MNRINHPTTPSAAPSRHSPDAAAAGFLDVPPDPHRYGDPGDDPAEVNGIVLGLVPRGVRVLDVGCGMGFMARLLRDRLDAQVVGVELDPSRAAAARSLGIEVHEEELSHELLARLGPFDAVLFLDVLEHLPDPMALLDVARAGLSPGGRVIASVPNVAHWTVRAKLLLGRFEYRDCGIMDATHLRWFTRSTIRRLFERAGLDVDFEAASAGRDLAVHHRRVFRWFGMRPVRALARAWPTLFGCQHVVRGAPRARPAQGEVR